MAKVRLTLVTQPFNCFRAVHVLQGETSAGEQPQMTLLRTCLCIGFYHAERRIGAISHITGFTRERGHYPAGALDEMERRLERLGVGLGECTCFVAGGSDKNAGLYQEAQAELTRRGLAYERLDTLGRCHRKLLFDPATGDVTIYRKEVGAGADVLQGESAEEGIKQLFHNPLRRVSTGATVFFRNQRLLSLIRDRFVPEILSQGSRMHVWCAGCSIGMEAYSVAIVILDALRARGVTADLRVLGTDISEEALETARRGEYPVSAKSRAEHVRLFDTYTESVDNCVVRVGPLLRQVVLFKQHDIRVGSRRHLFELVVCDHVLQYFSDAIQREFLDAMTRSIGPGGFLYASTPSHAIAESITQSYPFEAVSRHFYRRK